MKYSPGISNFLEEISSLSHSVVFLYFFALITEEGFLISACYSLKICIQMGISCFECNDIRQPAYWLTASCLQLDGVKLIFSFLLQSWAHCTLWGPRIALWMAVLYFLKWGTVKSHYNRLLCYALEIARCLVNSILHKYGKFYLHSRFQPESRSGLCPPEVTSRTWP